jgi:LmbE family N-acetylglucosaminyl deacetylase
MSAAVRRRLLAVFAHPDDESFLAGGTIARHAADGWDVRLITLTRGEAGRRGPYVDLSQQEFGALREAELRAACAALGVLDLHVLGFPDKGVGLHEAEALDTVTEVIARWQPALVLTFGPDGISGHTDHVAVSRIVTAAVERIVMQVSQYPFAAGPRLYYVARSPGVPGCCVSHDAAPPPPITTIVDVTDAADGKCRARDAYRSQLHLQAGATGATPDDLISEMFHRALPPWISRTPETVRLLP